MNDNIVNHSCNNKNILIGEVIAVKYLYNVLKIIQMLNKEFEVNFTFTQVQV